MLYLFLLYKLLNTFRAALCPSSGADDLVVFLPRVVQCRGCVGCQIRLAGCLSIEEYVARIATYPSSGAGDLVVFLQRVVQCRGCVGCQIRLAGCVSIGEYVARTPQWTHSQPTGSDSLHSHGTTPHATKIPLSRQLLRMGTRWPETC